PGGGPSGGPGGGHAAQENGAENPDVPSPEYSTPNNETTDPTPSPTVSVVLTGWLTLASCRAPSWGLVMSATVMSTTPPMRNVWRPPSSLKWMGSTTSPSIS